MKVCRLIFGLLLILKSLNAADIVDTAAPPTSTMKDCYTKSTPVIFCAPTTGISTVTNTSAVTSGYCCNFGS